MDVRAWQHVACAAHETHIGSRDQLGVSAPTFSLYTAYWALTLGLKLLIVDWPMCIEVVGAVTALWTEPTFVRISGDARGCAASGYGCTFDVAVRSCLIGYRFGLALIIYVFGAHVFFTLTMGLFSAALGWWSKLGKVSTWREMLTLMPQARVRATQTPRWPQ